MVLDLSEILAHPGMHQSYKVAEAPLVVDDLHCVDPIEGLLRFSNTGNALIIDGSVETRVSLTCSRCLVPMEAEVRVEIAEQFPLIHPHGPHPSHLAMVEEDLAPAAGGLFTGPLMDLTELLRQLIILELPAYPLHAEDCLGLCPVCGHDLNLGPCGCTASGRRSPFEALSQLLHDNIGSDDATLS